MEGSHLHDMTIGRPERSQHSRAHYKATTHNPGEQSCAHHDGTMISSQDMSPSLAIVQVDVTHKESPAVIPNADLVNYIEEHAPAVRSNSPLTFKTG